MVSSLVSLAVTVIIAWLLFEKVPEWFGIRGVFATILKVIAVIIVISALLNFV